MSILPDQFENINPSVKVAVIVLNFNHQKFILEALSGIARQKTHNLFSVDTFILDDCSTDNSLKLVDEFKEGIPDFSLHILKSSEKSGVRSNVLKMFDIQGYDYFSILDGDDYWTGDEKLYNQVMFLEKNKDYSGACHDAVILHEDDEARNILFRHAKMYSQVYSYKSELFPENLACRQVVIPTSSLIFRRKSLENVKLDLLTDGYSLDWKIITFLVMGSKFYFFNETWSTYRNHSKGISKSNHIEFYKSHIVFLKKLLNDDYYKRYKTEIYTALSNQYQSLLPMLKKSTGKNQFGIFINYILVEINRVYYKMKTV